MYQELCATPFLRAFLSVHRVTDFVITNWAELLWEPQYGLFEPHRTLHAMTALKAHCSRYVTFETLFHCGDTWLQSHCLNEPLQPASWDAYATLATNILDPIYEHFEKPELTFGFCGQQLRRLILNNFQPRIAPKLDQHASHELNSKLHPVCDRLGAAVDLYIPGVSSKQLAIWVASKLPFDRLYYYGKDKPIHVSVGPQRNSQITLLNNINGRLIPKRISLDSLTLIDEATQTEEPIEGTKKRGAYDYRL